MLKREKLLDILKTRFDYHAAQAVFNDVVSTLGLGAAETLDAGALQAVAALIEKMPGTRALVERLNALAAEPVVAAPAPELVTEAPAAESAPEVPAAAEAAPEDGAKKKKKK